MCCYFLYLYNMKNNKVRERNTEARRREYVGRVIRGCTVIDVARAYKNYSLVLKCNECGEVFRRNMPRFLRGEIQACHRNHVDKEREERLKLPKAKPNQNHGKRTYKNLIGKKVGRFTVLENVGVHYTRKGVAVQKYLCLCECGEKCVIKASSLKVRKMCDKELMEFKKEQGRYSAGVKAEKSKAKGKYKKPNFREINGRKIHKFSIKVYDKYFGVCQKCNTHFDKIDTASHHIIPIATKPSLAFFPSNGILLCKDCHDKFHNQYGSTAFNYKKIFEFIKNIKKNEAQQSIIWYS